MEISALALNEEENKSLEKDNSINDVSIYNEESLISDRYIIDTGDVLLLILIYRYIFK